MNKLWIFLSFLILGACNNTIDSGWPEKNLMEYGVPLTIRTPENVEVKRSRIAFQEDITIKGEGYDLQIFVSDAIVIGQEAAVTDQKVLVKQSPYFSSMIQEDSDGFVFENRVDSTHISYGFRYVKLMGGKEYLFQEGMMGSFTQEQIEATYRGIKQD